MFRKSISTLFGKFTLSFFLISCTVGASVLLLFYSHKRIEVNNALKYNVSELILDVEDIYKLSKENVSVGEDYKIKFSDKIDDFRLKFDKLSGDKLIKRFEMSDSSGKELHLNTLSSEEQLLYFSHNFWLRIRKSADYIQYNELLYDSLYSQVQLQEKWEPTDSTIKYLPLVKEFSKKTFTKEAKLTFENLHILCRKMKSKLDELQGMYDLKYVNARAVFNVSIVVVFFLNLFVVFFVYRFLGSQVFKPIREIHFGIKKIISGDINSTVSGLNDDELGEIATQINVLAFDIKNAHTFIKNLKLDEIESATIDTATVGDSTLTKALIEMRDKLLQIALNENQRNWVIEGQALFSDILSKHSSDFKQLSDEIVKKLVQYIGGLQGGLFVVFKNDSGEEYLELASCYAYDRKKFVNNKVEIGEGIVGQVWQERKGVYITDLPEDHMLIKSGLGDQQPSSLLVLPLIDNGIIYGVIELAAFKEIAQYKRDFVTKIAENIATALSGVEINKRTQLLLLESQDLTSKMKEQEEEMLQNLEELQATQEEMRRREMQKENELSQLQQRMEKRLEENDKREKDLKNEIQELKVKLVETATDNEGIRNLKAEMQSVKEGYELKLKDLEETIRIKDLRVEKLRKRIDKLNE